MMQNVQINRSFLLLGMAFLWSACATPNDLAETVEVGQSVLQNEELKTAGQDVIDGGKAIWDGGSSAVKTIGGGAVKVWEGGRVIVGETQAILNGEPSAPTDTTEAVLVREDTESCEGDEKCFLWRESETAPWQRLVGTIENWEDLSGQLETWQVRLSAMEDFVNTWTVDEVK